MCFILPYIDKILCICYNTIIRRDVSLTKDYTMLNQSRFQKLAVVPFLLALGNSLPHVTLWVTIPIIVITYIIGCTYRIPRMIKLIITPQPTWTLEYVHLPKKVSMVAFDPSRWL